MNDSIDAYQGEILRINEALDKWQFSEPLASVLESSQPDYAGNWGFLVKELVSFALQDFPVGYWVQFKADADSRGNETGSSCRSLTCSGVVAVMESGEMNLLGVVEGTNSIDLAEAIGGHDFVFRRIGQDEAVLSIREIVGAIAGNRRLIYVISNYTVDPEKSQDWYCIVHRDLHPLGLVDEEYGWPHQVQLSDIQGAMDIAPGRHKDPMIHDEDRWLACTLSPENLALVIGSCYLDPKAELPRLPSAP